MTTSRAPNAFAFWALFVLAFPLTILQAVYTRLRAPRLPPVIDNAARGTIVVDGAAAAPFELLVVGESTAVGVGCAREGETIAVRLAQAISTRRACSVEWQVIGANGATLSDLEGLLPSRTRQSPSANRHALVLAGANDTVSLTPVKHWREGMIRIRNLLRHRGVTKIYFAPVPPMWQFTLLPQPLRAVIGERALMLDFARYAVAEPYPDIHVLDSDFPNNPSLLASDGYHPGPEACRIWAEQVAAQMD
ncbi:MAG: SGNH/GDSL hydrolase family protein [Pseudomonadota bacterium]